MSALNDPVKWNLDRAQEHLRAAAKLAKEHDSETQSTVERLASMVEKAVAFLGRKVGNEKNTSDN
jgi:hypothetical protein